MYLSDNQIEYVFFHLWQHLSKDFFETDPFLVIKKGEKISEDFKNKVIFVLSENEKPDPVDVFFKDQFIPVLFGNGHGAGSAFKEDGNGNLWFLPDFLSSAFWLLSGMQEVITPQKDRYGRFSYESSIQKQLGCVHLPLVNYYFEMIIEGLEFYGQKHDFKIERKRLFDNFGFVLSHDVDRISFFHPFRVLHKIKQLIGFAPLNYSRGKTALLFVRGVLFNLNPFRKADPWWNFDWMTALEKRMGLRSTFFFLKQEDRFDNSLYKFHFKKIKKLVKRLKEDEFEVGLHGTMRSAMDRDNLQQQKHELAKATGEEPVGIRQHYLRFFHPHTFKIQESAGLVYDTSLGFAEHDGFRNGYCYPFHPYDFEADEMMKIWEIPLTMMEVSVLQYRKEGFEALRSSVFHYISEAMKFGGLFSLLWHNCRLCEYEYEGVTEFYEGLLEEIVEKGCDNQTGFQIIKRISGK